MSPPALPARAFSQANQELTGTLQSLQVEGLVALWRCGKSRVLLETSRRHGSFALCGITFKGDPPRPELRYRRGHTYLLPVRRFSRPRRRQP